jgi:hypothetical protein
MIQSVKTNGFNLILDYCLIAGAAWLIVFCVYLSYEGRAKYGIIGLNGEAAVPDSLRKSFLQELGKDHFSQNY